MRKIETQQNVTGMESFAARIASPFYRMSDIWKPFIRFVDWRHKLCTCRKEIWTSITEREIEKGGNGREKLQISRLCWKSCPEFGYIGG